MLSPSTPASALNPSELIVRGAAIQASLIQEFDKEDIEQSSHPMVTVTPHLAHAIGVVVIGSSGDAEEKEKVEPVFRPLLQAETAAPARRTAFFKGPANGGDVLVRLCEGLGHIQVTRPEPKPKRDIRQPKHEDDDDDDDGEDEDEDDDDDEDEDEIRRKIWKVGTILAEAAVRDLPKNSTVEVMVSVNADLSLVFTARQPSTKGGVRGVLDKPPRMDMNGNVGR